MSTSDYEQLETPTPDPALTRLDRLVGTWTLRGNLVDSDEENITGEIRFGWLEGGFFLRQEAHTEFAGMFTVDALELIGYDPRPRPSPRTCTPTSRPCRSRTRGTSRTTC